MRATASPLVFDFGDSRLFERLEHDAFVIGARCALGADEPLAQGISLCPGCGGGIEGDSHGVAQHLALCQHASEQPMGRFRDHRAVGFTIYHNAIVSTLMLILREAGYRPMREAAYIFGRSSNRRPADVGVLQYECARKQLAVDVTVLRVSSQTGLSASRQGTDVGRARSAREDEKTDSYKDELQAHPRVQFVPFVIDEFGAMGRCAAALLRTLAARRAGRRIKGNDSSRLFAAEVQRALMRWHGMLAETMYSTRATLLLAMTDEPD
jgi:hypothetical protein